MDLDVRAQDVLMAMRVAQGRPVGDAAERQWAVNERLQPIGAIVILGSLETPLGFARLFPPEKILRHFGEPRRFVRAIAPDVAVVRRAWQ